MVYHELVIGIIICTSVINHAYRVDYYINLKWLSLALAIFGGVIYYFTHKDSSVWTILVSFAAATFLYDYVVKVLRDLFTGENPFGPQI